MKKAIIIIISVLVILAGTGAILWFFTPVFDFLKPARDNFAIQAKKLFGASKEVSYEDYIKSIEPLKGESKSYVSNVDISANVQLPSNIIDYSTQRMINNTSLKIESSYDNDSKATSTAINWGYGNSNVLDFKMVKDGRKVTLSSKDFYDKALTFDMDKFKAFCKANYPEISDAELDKLDQMMNNTSSEELSNMMYELLYLTEDEYKALSKDLSEDLKNLIDKDNYTTKKNQKVTVNGEEVKTTGYSLTISGKDIYNYIRKLAENAKKNDNLKSILVKKANLLKKYAGTLAQMGIDEYDTVSTNPINSSTSITGRPTESAKSLLDRDIEKSDIEEFIDQFLDAFEEAESEFSSIKKSVKITIYANKKSEPVRMDIAIVDDKDDDGDVIISEEVGKNKNTYTIDIQAIGKIFGTDVSSSTTIPVDKIVIVDEIETKNDTTRKGKMTASIKASGQKVEIGTIDYEIVRSKSEFKNNFKISSQIVSSINIDVKMEMTGLDSDYQTSLLDINANVASYKVNVKANATTEYGRANIEKFNEQNSVDMFTKSKEEINQIITDIVTKASDVLPGRLANYGIRITKQDILSLIQGTTTADPGVATPTEEQNNVAPAA